MRHRILAHLVLSALLASCVSTKDRIEGEATQLIDENDALLRAVSPAQAFEVEARYTDFLSRLPAHPSLDRVRIRIHLKRAEAHRLAHREDLAGRDEKMAELIRKSAVAQE